MKYRPWKRTFLTSVSFNRRETVPGEAYWFFCFHLSDSIGVRKTPLGGHSSAKRQISDCLVALVRRLKAACVTAGMLNKRSTVE
jgi:hypothetical protein